MELLDDEGVWTGTAVYRMLLSVLTILSHVHRKGVIHRDIKAANVMRREEDGVFFLVDFGACTHIAHDMGKCCRFLADFGDFDSWDIGSVIWNSILKIENWKLVKI